MAAMRLCAGMSFAQDELNNSNHPARVLGILMNFFLPSSRREEIFTKWRPYYQSRPQRKEKGNFRMRKRHLPQGKRTARTYTSPAWPTPPHPFPNRSDRLHIVRRPYNQNTYMPPPLWPTHITSKTPDARNHGAGLACMTPMDINELA